MRRSNSLKNFITSVIPFMILILIGFWKVNVWQRSLDEDVYALNQLFFQIFSYLSLAEAGIGALVQKEYYRLFVINEKEEICVYYTLSKRMLRRVCLIIMIAGLCCSFLLPALSNGNTLSLHYMQKIFFLFLLKSLVEYFLFSPRFVLQADQQIYKINVQMNIYKIAEGIMETLLIMGGVSFELVLIATFFLRIVMNLHINRIIFREYPWLHTVPDVKGRKIRGMQHVLLYKVVSVIYENVDLLLVSSFINPLSVIIYSNYKYITKYLGDLIYMIGSSITSSLGNLMYSENPQYSYNTYEMINTMFYFIACILTITLGYCMNAFIVIWVGPNKLLDTISLVCILFTFFHTIVRRPQYMLKDIFAFYEKLQGIFIAESILNLLLSYLLVQLAGIQGVLFATVISTLLTNFWYFPVYLYKTVFGKKPWLDFFKYGSTFAVTGIGLWFSWRFLPPMPSKGYISWFLYSGLYFSVVLFFVTVIFFVLFKSFRRLVWQGLEMVKGLFSKK